jgi:hypothetical protein
MVCFGKPARLKSLMLKGGMKSARQSELARVPGWLRGSPPYKHSLRLEDNAKWLVWTAAYSGELNSLVKPEDSIKLSEYQKIYVPNFLHLAGDTDFMIGTVKI